LGVPLWAIVANYPQVFAFHRCRIDHRILKLNYMPRDNAGIIGNFERIMGSFGGNKRIE